MSHSCCGLKNSCGGEDSTTEGSPNKVGDSYQMRKKAGEDNDAASVSSVSSADSSGQEGLESYVRTRPHHKILSRLQSMQLGDRSANPHDSDHRTVFHSLLANATNGDQILLRKLDECVSATHPDENDPDHAIEVNLTPLLEGNNDNQVDIIKDMLDFKDTAAREVLLHPVIQTFLEIKWRRIRKIFFGTFFTYVLFLVSYSGYLANIFYRKDKTRRIKVTELVIGKDRIVFPSDSDLEIVDTIPDRTYINRTRHAHMFETCLIAGVPSLTCATEIILLTTLTIIAVQEILQFYALGPRRYLREFENLLELLVIGLVVAGMIMQYNFKALKWISAFGICLAYLELIFLMGRYPFLGGAISLMFYNITKHLGKSLSNFFVLITGFGFGFFIMHHKKSTENFENPWKAILKTLTMALGEFDFNDLWDAHGNDTYSRLFTMFLLVGLAVMGTLVLINLIVAIIVSDIEQLRKQAHLQELVNKAQHIIFIEGLMSYVFCFCLPVHRMIRVSNCVQVCGHNLCRCKAKRMDADVVRALKKIVRKKRILEQINKIGASANTAPSSAVQPARGGGGDANVEAVRAFLSLFKADPRPRVPPARGGSGVGEVNDGGAGVRGGNVLADFAEILIDANI